jgi:hypothetical protein
MAEPAVDKIRSILNRLQQVCRVRAVQYACMLPVHVTRCTRGCYSHTCVLDMVHATAQAVGHVTTLGAAPSAAAGSCP